MKFHRTCHGKNVILTEDATVATRTDSWNNGIVFGDRHVAKGEKVTIEIRSTTISRWSGAFFFGFTNHDPDAIDPESLPWDAINLTDKPGYWVQRAAPKEDVAEGVIFSYFYTDDGVKCLINGKPWVSTGDSFPFGKDFKSSVNIQKPIWPVIELYGQRTSVKILGVADPVTPPPTKGSLFGKLLPKFPSSSATPLTGIRYNGTATDIACGYYRECLEVRKVINLSEKVTDLQSKFNKCYCNDCHTRRGESYSFREGSGPHNLYTKPVGWGRIMLKLPPRADELDIFNNWNAAFHGTSPDNIRQIVIGGELLFPGDTTMHGEKLREVEGHFNDARKPTGFDTKQVFLSPSIKYSGSEVYAKMKRVRLPDSGRYVYIRTVLQVRVKPDQFTVGPQTIGRSDPIDPPIGNDVIEWSLTARNCVIPTAILIQVQDSEGYVEPQHCQGVDVTTFASNWSETDVQDWLKKNKLDDLCDHMEGYDGAHLQMLYKQYRDERKEFQFEKDMKSDYQMNSKVYLKFTVALEKLFK